MNKQKKIWIGVIALILVAAGILTWVLVPKTPTKEVPVYSFDMTGYVNYYGTGTESYGIVATDRVQSVFVTDTQKVTEILVYQGQEVKKGDVLYRYDTTLSQLELERKDLSIQQMEMNLKNAQEELKTLKAMKAMVIPSGSQTKDDDEDEKITKVPSDATLGVPFSGTGANTRNAYRVWVKSTTSITDDMIESYLGAGKEVYVIFCYASSAGGTITNEVGVRFIRSMRDVIVEEDPTAPTTNPTTGPSEEPTAEPTEDPATEPTTQPTDPTETQDQMEESEQSQAQTDQDEEQSAQQLGGLPGGVPADDGQSEDSTEVSPDVLPSVKTEQQEFIDMRFFTPSSAGSVDTTNDSIVWNSGYTSSELVSMRNEKSKEIDELTFQIKIAKAELKIMEKEADDGEVKAEFDGIVSSVLEPQNAQEVNAPMIKVTGGGGFYVEGAVSELDLATIQLGQAVSVTSWDTYMTYEGTVVEIGQYPTEDGNYYSYGASNVSYYPYKVFIDETADLQEGYYVSMTYQSEPSEEGIMYLENAFLRTENGESFVYVRSEDGLLEKRVVQIGDSSDGYMTQILSGLSQTDYIAFPYGNEVVEGAPTVEGTWEDLYGY